MASFPQANLLRVRRGIITPFGVVSSMRLRSSPYDASQPIVAELAAGGVVLRHRDRQVLLLHEEVEDRWTLPKGHVEKGESLLAAAEREVREETGIHNLHLEADLGEVTYRFFDPGKGSNVLKVVVYFLFSTPEEKTVPEAIFDQVRWSPIPEAVREVHYGVEQSVLSRVLQRESDKNPR